MQGLNSKLAQDPTGPNQVRKPKTGGLEVQGEGYKKAQPQGELRCTYETTN
jgi:hypothetical protein